ncbi:MAG: tetratricopeptide repeat protein [Gammaproteobacteria bacterium]
MRRLTLRSTLRLPLIALVCGLLGACASGPKPQGDGTPVAFDKRFAPAFGHMQSESWSDAETALLRLSKSHANDARYHLNLGIVYSRTSRFDEAYESLLKAKALAPRAAVVHNELGIVLRQRGEFPGAAQAYRAAIKADPEYAKAHYNLGVLLDLYLRQHSEALVHYEAYLSMTPSADKAVASWVKDLQRRTAAGPSTASSDAQVERR